jgi:hypothetical protein
MSEDPERQNILAEIAEAFAVPRPAWFVNARHCCECAEHEAELQAETVDTLRREVLGDGGWDPVAFISNPDGFKYFMPALARLAYGIGPDFHLTSFLIYLQPERIATFDERQSAAVERLLVHLGMALAGELSNDHYLELEWALRRVRGEPGPCAFMGQA